MPDRMTSLPQQFQGVGSGEPRAATASRLSRLASSSAKLASTNARRWKMPPDCVPGCTFGRHADGSFFTTGI